MKIRLDRDFASRLGSRALCGFYGKDACEPRTSAKFSKDYSLVYILQGSGIYRDHDHEMRFSRGWIVQRLPEIAHEIVYDTDVAMTNASMHLPRHAFELLAQAGLRTSTVPTFNIGYHQEMVPRFQAIIDELKWQPDERLFVTLAKMQALVTELHALAVENQPQRSPRVTKACKYIDEHVTDDLQVPDIATHLGTSESHLRRLFVKEIGLSPHQYLIRARIKAVQQLLCTTNLPVKEIADAMNYSNQYVLSRQFKHICSITPSEYRQRYQM